MAKILITIPIDSARHPAPNAALDDIMNAAKCAGADVGTPRLIGTRRPAYVLPLDVPPNDNVAVQLKLSLPGGHATAFDKQWTKYSRDDKK